MPAPLTSRVRREEDRRKPNQKTESKFPLSQQHQWYVLLNVIQGMRRSNKQRCTEQERRENTEFGILLFKRKQKRLVIKHNNRLVMQEPVE